MANTYRDMTGVLQAKKITPVIKALFGDCDLEEAEKGEGTIGFRLMAEGNSQTWDGIISSLASMAEDLGCEKSAFSEGEDEKVNAEALIWALAKHFGKDDDEELASFVEQCSFEDDASLDAVFLLARLFDDGHELKSMQYEGAWHCDRARIGEFGGFGGFMGKEIFVSGDSSDWIDLGESLERALSNCEVHKAADKLRTHIGKILAAIADDDMRTEVRLGLASLLREPTVAEGSSYRKASVEELQALVAEQLFGSYSFGNSVLFDGVDGWQYETPGNERSRKIYLANDSEETATVEKATFTVRYEPGTAIVEEAYAIDAKGNIFGSCDRHEYYIWVSSDCQDKTDNLGQALQWLNDFLAEGRDAYIADEENRVIDLALLLKR